MQTGYIEGGGRVAAAAGWVGSYRTAATTPLEPGEILAGHLLFIAFRLLTSSAAFVAVMAVFGVGAGWWVLAALPAALLTGLAFAAPVAAWAVGLRSIGKIQAGFRFVLMPMYMFSGTFFALDQLPHRRSARRVRAAALSGRRPLPVAQPRHRVGAQASPRGPATCSPSSWRASPSARVTYRRRLHA